MVIGLQPRPIGTSIQPVKLVKSSHITQDERKERDANQDSSP
jgi:hypothetical protein